MKEFNRLVDIVKTLRSPNGCPWDKEQTLYSMKKSLMEEASELIDALDNKDIENIKEELGDVLLHVVLHSQIAAEENFFSIDDVAKDICEKLIRRHPHVFADTKVSSVNEVLTNWDKIKLTENKPKPNSLLDKTPKNMPSLFQAEDLQKRAAKVGFDWNSIDDVFKKLDEEMSELKEAIQNKDSEEITNELGDVLFVMANVARHCNINADEALRRTNNKFRKRFNYIEEQLGDKIKESTLEEMDKLWNDAKKLAK